MLYVDLPPLQKRTTAPNTNSEDERKENSPLKPSSMNSRSPHRLSTSKRKLLDMDSDDEDVRETPATVNKKQRVFVDVPERANKKKEEKSNKSSQDEKVKETRPASEEFPNGGIYCHQCGKKRDKSRKLSFS